MRDKLEDYEIIQTFSVNESRVEFNSTDNGTDYEYDEEHWQDQPMLWIILLLSTAVFIMGIVGNILVWFAVWRNHRMRSATNLFLVNLALADFLVILICLPPTVISDVTGNWPLGTELCKAIHYLQKVSVFVSVLTLTAISMERWMAICRPLWFRQTSVRAKRIIVLLWGVSFACACPDLVVLETEYIPQLDSNVCRPMWDLVYEKISLLAVFVLFYFIPLVIMTFAYVKVAVCLWRSGSANDMGATAGVPRAQLLIRQKKAKMLIVVVLIFAICFLPVYILYLLLCSDVMVPGPLRKPIALITHFLCYFNSAVNPVIYNFMSCNFRREFKDACRVCCRSGHHGNPNYSAHDGFIYAHSPESTRKTRVTGSPNMTIYRAVLQTKNRKPISAL